MIRMTDNEELWLSRHIATLAAIMLTGYSLMVVKTLAPLWLQIAQVPFIFASVLALGHFYSAYNWKNTWLFSLHKVLSFVMVAFLLHEYHRGVLKNWGYNPVTFEAGEIALFLVGGAIVGVLIFTPFKVIQVFYYLDGECEEPRSSDLSAVGMMRKEKRKADAKFEKQLSLDRFKAQLPKMTRTELEIALKSAVDGDEFEKAQLIQDAIQGYRNIS